MFYYPWKHYLRPDNDLEIIPLDYKGHGLRADESFYRNFNEMVDDMLSLLLKYVRANESFMLFGHSMGSYVAFRISDILQEKHIYAKHVFLSGSTPPCFWTRRKKKMSDLPDHEFMDEVISFGGIDHSVMDYPEVYDFIVKILRNDFRIIETISSDLPLFPIRSNISILNGYDDSLVSKKNISRWEDYSLGKCTIKFYNGGHFYITDHLNEICDYISGICRAETRSRCFS